MIRLNYLVAATLLASTAALAQEPSPAPAEPAAPQEPPGELKALVESCSAHKFETTVELAVDGVRRGRKVTLCGKEGQSDADWVVTLKDAAAKTQANESMSPAAREQIVAALKAEIEKVEAQAAVRVELPAAVTPPVRPLAEYSVVPPLPEPLPATKIPSNVTASAAVATGSAALAASTGRPPVAAPRLSIKCARRGEGAADCSYLEPDMTLAIRAENELVRGATLRFLRRGDAKGEVQLEQMRQGETATARLPSRLCAGVVASKVEIQVLASNGSIVESLGPYRLDCS